MFYVPFYRFKFPGTKKNAIVQKEVGNEESNDWLITITSE